jgi:hypothetical protein
VCDRVFDFPSARRGLRSPPSGGVEDILRFSIVSSSGGRRGLGSACSCWVLTNASNCAVSTNEEVLGTGVVFEGRDVWWWNEV